jgi:hypothetical protein
MATAQKKEVLTQAMDSGTYSTCATSHRQALLGNGGQLNFEIRSLGVCATLRLSAA